MRKNLTRLSGVCLLAAVMMTCACAQGEGSENSGTPTLTTAPTAAPTTAPTKAPTNAIMPENGESPQGGSQNGNLPGSNSQNSDTNGNGGAIGDVIDGVGDAVDDMTGGNGAGSSMR